MFRGRSNHQPRGKPAWRPLAIKSTRPVGGPATASKLANKEGALDEVTVNCRPTAAGGVESVVAFGSEGTEPGTESRKAIRSATSTSGTTRRPFRKRVSESILPS